MSRSSIPLLVFMLLSTLARAQVVQADAIEDHAADLDRAGLYEESSLRWQEAAKIRKEDKQWNEYFLDRAYYANALSKRSKIRALSREMRDISSELDSLKSAYPEVDFDTVELIIRRFDIITSLEQNNIGRAERICNSIIADFEAIEDKTDYDRQILISQYFRKAELLIHKGSFEHAIEYNGKALSEISEGNYADLYLVDGAILRSYLQNADCYLALKDTASLLFEFDRMKAHLGRLGEKVEERKFEVYERIFDYYLANGQQDSARAYLVKLQQLPLFSLEADFHEARYARTFLPTAEAIPIMRTKAKQINSYVGTRHRYSIAVNLDIASLYLDAGDTRACLDQIDLVKSIFSKGESEFQSVSEIIGEEAPRLYVELMDLESRAFMAAYSNSGEPADLRLAWQRSRNALRVIDRIRASYMSETDRQFLLANSYGYYEHALNVCYARYTSGTQFESAWSDTAFQLMERSKSISLLDIALHRNAFRYTALPDSLRIREAAMRARIRKLQDDVDDAERKGDLHREYYVQKQSDLIDQKKSYRQFILSVEERFPAVARMKNIRRVAGLADVKQRLRQDSMGLIEFFYGDEVIYMLITNGHQDQLVRNRAPGKLGNLCRELIHQVRKFSAEPAESGIRAYIEAAHGIYVQTLGQIDFDMPVRVQLIPDGPLRGISFASLLYAKPEPGAYLYDFPFAIRLHQFSYLYSHTLQAQLSSTEGTPVQIEVDALAPEFGPGLRESFPDEPALEPLPFNRMEISGIDGSIPTRHKVGQQADKETFLSLAGSGEPATVLHLASHAVADHMDGDLSFIRFSVDATDQAGSKLFARELYTMDLPYHLVFLSACETATGEVLRGEGFVGLARGFFYAGVESMVSTLWTVNDEAGVHIVSDFYDCLSLGDQKDKALRKAQLSYLDRQGEMKDKLHAHPFYWAAYIPVGDLSGMSSPSTGTGFFMYLGLGLLVVLIILHLIRKGRRVQRQ